MQANEEQLAALSGLRHHIKRYGGPGGGGTEGNCSVPHIRGKKDQTPRHWLGRTAQRVTDCSCEGRFPKLEPTFFFFWGGNTGRGREGKKNKTKKRTYTATR